MKINKWDISVLIAGGIFLIIAALLLDPIKWAFYLAVVLLMMFVSYTDIHFRKIKTKSMYILLLLGFISIFITNISIKERILTVLMVGGALIATILLTNKLMHITKSVGGGDFRILVYSGLMFGFYQMYVIAIGFVITLMFSLAATLLKGKEIKELPGYRICLGPFIAFAMCLVLLYILQLS